MPAAKFNRAMRIDTTHRRPAPAPTAGSDRRLPANAGVNDPRRNLAFRNLTRAKMVKLATGQQMATFLKNKGVNLTKLTKAQIRDGNGGADPRRAHAGRSATPCQEHAAVVLHPARGRAQRRQAQGRRRADRRRDVPPGDGGQRSSRSCATRPSRPTLGPDSTTFRMVDLLLFAFEGKKALLAPNG